MARDLCGFGSFFFIGSSIKRTHQWLLQKTVDDDPDTWSEMSECAFSTKGSPGIGYKFFLDFFGIEMLTLNERQLSTTLR